MPANEPADILPVTCPQCGESQNTMDGGFGDDGLPVGPVGCMVCNYQFTREEYLARLEMRRHVFARMTGPGPIPS